MIVYDSTFAAGSQSTTGIIVGVLVAVLILIAAIVLAALRRRRQQAKTNVTNSLAYISNTKTQGKPDRVSLLPVAGLTIVWHVFFLCLAQ